MRIARRGFFFVQKPLVLCVVVPTLGGMNSDPQINRLKRLMTSYEGRDHCVTAFFLSQDEVGFLGAGQGLEDVAPSDTLFEIGSITKVFTAILMCVLAEEGVLDPKAPLRDMSSGLAVVPDWITPERLASHTSGLPRIHVPIWKALIKPLPKDPYAVFSRDDLLAWMQEWSQKARQGKPSHSYSNLGVGLLGEAMAIQAGVPYFDLLADKVLVPLGMQDTVQSLSTEQYNRFARPKTPKGKPVPDWTFQSMAAAGCLRSSTADLARFARAVLKALEAPETVLDRAFVRSAAPVFGLGVKGGMEPAAQCLGWFRNVHGKTKQALLHHDGGTAGSTSAIYICPETSEACAVLSNNGIAANLWAGTKFGLSNPLAKAHDVFQAR